MSFTDRIAGETVDLDHTKLFFDHLQLERDLTATRIAEQRKLIEDLEETQESPLDIKMELFRLEAEHLNFGLFLDAKEDIAFWMMQRAESLEGKRTLAPEELNEDWHSFRREFQERASFASRQTRYKLSHTLTKVLDLLVTGECKRRFPLRA